MVYFSTFDSIVFVFAKFHALSKCPKTLRCWPLSLFALKGSLYEVFATSYGSTWLKLSHCVENLISREKNHPSFSSLIAVTSSEKWQAWLEWPNLGWSDSSGSRVPLDTDSQPSGAKGRNFELRITQRVANSTQRVTYIFTSFPQTKRDIAMQNMDWGWHNRIQYWESSSFWWLVVIYNIWWFKHCANFLSVQ